MCSFDMCVCVCTQSLLGLQHMHSKKIIHRDIKALNLFIDYQDNIKVRLAHSIHCTQADCGLVTSASLRRGVCSVR